MNTTPTSRQLERPIAQLASLREGAEHYVKRRATLRKLAVAQLK